MHGLTNRVRINKELQHSVQVKHDAEVRVVLNELNESHNDACQIKALVADLKSILETTGALLVTPKLTC